MARKKNKRVKSQAAPAPAPPTRRETLARLGWFGLAGAVVAGVGVGFALDFHSKAEETDLSRIGKGIPAIVQIHDPNCALCRDLQRETRAALKAFDKQDLIYLVAHIQSLEGADFQAQMGLPNVSLVLMDRNGMRVSHVQGVTPRAALVAKFREDLRL